MGWKQWVRERLDYPEFQEHIQNQVIVQAASASAYDAMVPAPADGWVRYVDDTKRMELRARGTWQPIPAGLVDVIVGAWPEPPGVFGINPTTLTQVDVPDPGRPYRVAVNAMCEVGSVAAGTRWDLWVRITNSSANGNLDYTIARQEAVGFQRLDSAISPTIFTGSLRVIVEARRAYGTANGEITAFNKRVNVYRHAA